MSSNTLQRTMKSQLIQSHSLTSHLAMENHMEKFLECFLIRRPQTTRLNLLTKQIPLNREENTQQLKILTNCYCNVFSFLLTSCYIVLVLTREADLFPAHFDGMHFFFQKCKGFL